MGNCVKSTTRNKQQEEEELGQCNQEYEEKEMEAEFEKESSDFDDDEEKGSPRVKIVLTKEELEWLMFQLKVNNGSKKSEDVLQEIERERVRGKANKAWKPSLESIMENPEED